MSEQIDDYDELVRVLGLYMEGAGKGDLGLLNEAFHEDARMYGELAGTRYDVPITQFFEIAASAPADTGSYRGRVLSVHQVGDAANAGRRATGTLTRIALSPVAIHTAQRRRQTCRD
jgi:hypothetical protein